MSSGEKSRSLLGSAMLMLGAFIWGTAFVAQSVGMDHLGPFTFSAVRCLIGSVALAPAAWIFGRIERGRQPENREKGHFWETYRPLITGGVVCGVILAVATNFQQIALKTVSPGKAGFLTALYIVIVPLLGLFLGKRPGWKVWVAAAAALCGLWFLSVQGDFSIAAGDLALIACALFFSFHILAIDHFSPKVNGVAMSCLQFLTAGLLSLGAALLFETVHWADLLAAWGPLLYTGILSSGVAYTLQILGQKSVKPTVASLIMSLESVFAALAGWAVLGEPLTPRELLGCGLVFGAVVLAQLPSRKERESL